MFLNAFLLLCTFSTAFSKSQSYEESFVSRGVTNFGANLLKAIINATRTEQNILISPLNVYTALALTHLGADGLTYTELRNILGMPKDVSRPTIHATLSEMIQKIEGKVNGTTAPSFTESALANGLFVQNGFKIRNTYVESANQFYKVSPISVDFVTTPKKATDTINRWVANKTKNRIPQLYKYELEPSISLLLTCALYFSGKWSESFYESKTQKAKFTLQNNEKIDVYLMNNVKRVPYITDLSYQYEAIRLPYERNEYEMIIVLPSGRQTLRNLTAHMKYDSYQKIFNHEGTDGTVNGVDYKIPRMKFSWSKSVKEPLSRNGVRTLFEKADLSHLVETSDFRVSDITHATEIEVDEKGTRASAITAIKFVPYIYSRDPSTPKSFVVDRPFLMMIYNRPTSTLLFYGCVYNPLASVG